MNILVIISAYLLVFLSGVFGVCVDKNALFVINATVHPHYRSRGRNVTNDNFYLLDKQNMIDVYQSNITDLCEGMIKNFPVLESLSFISVNLSTIQPNCFQNVPRLKQLSLAANNLREIPRGSFNNLESLETIYLSANEISSIEENAFADMQKLKAVHLDRNRIVEINGNAFRGCSRIRLLNFKFNLIQSLSQFSFEDLSPMHNKPISIYLNRNRIQEVDLLDFNTENPVDLHLNGNQIRQFSNLFHGLTEMSKLYLNDNQINCVADDIIENMRQTTKEVYLLNNPINCDCLDRLDKYLGYEIYGNGNIYYNSTFNCKFAKSIIFDK